MAAAPSEKATFATERIISDKAAADFRLADQGKSSADKTNGMRAIMSPKAAKIGQFDLVRDNERICPENPTAWVPKLVGSTAQELVRGQPFSRTGRPMLLNALTVKE